MGAKKRPFYRLVVADARSPRDGRFIEAVGTYDPLSNPATVTINAERVKDWISKGARPTDVARQILVNEGLLERTGPVYDKKADAAKLSKKAQAKAAEAAKSAAAAEAAAAEAAAAPPSEEAAASPAEESVASPAEEASAPAAEADKSVAPDADAGSPASESAPEAAPPAPDQHAGKPAEGAAE